MAQDEQKTINPIIVGGKTALADIDPHGTCGYDGDKVSAAVLLTELKVQLQQLQTLVYAGASHKILVVLQAMDTGGKDGVLRSVFTGVNPQGMRVASFKAPSAEELKHDYLWRVHHEMPPKGMLHVFNRGHYEDVLITRVHGLIDDATAKRRFRQINDFEAMAVEEGTIILKFFLHISKAEQKERLETRLKEPTRQWKFNINDVAEREHWDDYQRVYQDALNATSTKNAPWYVVPADRKWLRDLYVASVLVQTLSALDMQFPAVAGLKKIVIKD